MEFVVVSWPAKSSSAHMAVSSSSSRWSSPSAAMSAESMSSPGSARRCSINEPK